jgi:hypothetical protein
MIMGWFSHQSRIVGGIAVFLISFSFCDGIPAVSGADIEIEANLGDTINLHGFSYVGDSIYLFLTGPGLPENGVTLTDTSLRADQGQFTVVGVDDNQEWTYNWKTSRIDAEIDPGTYTVYATSEPADLSHLGGSASYKTLSVFLKDSGVSKVSIGAEHVYTLKPDEDDSTPIPAPPMNITTATPVTTSPPPTSAIPVTLVQTASPTTRADTGPWVALTALFCGICLISFFKIRP